MKTKYELILYSSLNRRYLQPIIDYLEQKEKYFQYSFDESYCLSANMFQGVKCLNFLCETRSLKNVIAVDTSVKSFPLNPENVLPVPCDSLFSDTTLAKLGAILDSISKENSVREAMRRYYKLSCKIHFNIP
eukprot:TRINITY_DN4825_c0_g1_i1.p1 TRINITY_DN4825_c0_g1~~TRINITY_DN4825_c0_g1_i1.p1  ORF type:complete len:132 (+),score=22.34 TRINITY_DN4825_c0_g1_i1:448-843(+)